MIGLGSSATFAQVVRAEAVTALKAVFQMMADKGARVFDTAPSYGASEPAAGKIVNEMGMAKNFFWATKVNFAAPYWHLRSSRCTRADRTVPPDLRATEN